LKPARRRRASKK